jgi:hypothetical protein
MVGYARDRLRSSNTKLQATLASTCNSNRQRYSERKEPKTGAQGNCIAHSSPQSVGMLHRQQPQSGDKAKEGGVRQRNHVRFECSRRWKFEITEV